MLLELERSGLFLTADEAVFLRRRAKLRPLIARLGEQKGHGEIGATTNPDIVLSMAALFEDDISPRRPRSPTGRRLRAPSDGGFPAFELGAASNLLAYARTRRWRLDSSCPRTRSSVTSRTSTRSSTYGIAPRPSSLRASGVCTGDLT
jgi:hypothetical protein